ncbi:hypothetical protein M3398_23550 [Streptomyces albidoflavus]|uniref:hypothetical protein n=1 Tax=Streptomyces TaxID=1883 RepID=UPI00101E9D66|nr:MULTISPECIES: hypothetical protein [Streptomyces]MBV7254673.1 hypothetical protein [Streptomyces sp. S-2]MCL6280258.1 hypothetical protein [Streptomyces albidoflavus]MCX4466290.1 hypothetical protein [Streptomyces albidoflavus]RZE73829.1 hypothetical protein C0Q99_20350 [Streptomyces albidoflavus]WSI92340.1 hypothetical protein OG695_10890 [Streptomyces albidoflavus]
MNEGQEDAARAGTRGLTEEGRSAAAGVERSAPESGVVARIALMQRTAGNAAAVKVLRSASGASPGSEEARRDGEARPAAGL